MKKPMIITISLAAAVAVVCVSIGGYRIYKNANTRVEVSPVSAISVPLWEDNSSYGTVTTDLTQDVYITENQVIQEILVSEGDTVSVGTPLMTIDTTLATLDLEMQALAIDNIDLQIQAANRDIHFLETAAIGYNIPDHTGGDEGLEVSMKADGHQLLSSPGAGNADPDAISLPTGPSDCFIFKRRHPEYLYRKMCTGNHYYTGFPLSNQRSGYEYRP